MAYRIVCTGQQRCRFIVVTKSAITGRDSIVYWSNTREDAERWINARTEDEPMATIDALTRRQNECLACSREPEWNDYTLRWQCPTCGQQWADLAGWNDIDELMALADRHAPHVHDAFMSAYPDIDIDELRSVLERELQTTEDR